MDTARAAPFDPRVAAETVAADLDRVLGPAPDWPEPAPRAIVRRSGVAGAATERAARIGLIIAAGFVGIAIGLAISGAFS